ncbi:MAG: hypothetical protein CMC76_09875 [Flavobacteriaceae bacterium]|nr:hypothetical protein [Flavobacteriaceae bacterium]
MVEEQNNYTYHYFHPLMLTEVEQESAIPLPKIVPAFFLKANEDKSFWSNVITGIEYGVDIITTLSGIGNIAKFRHLAKVAKVASRFNKFDKARRYASVVSKIRLASGAIEVSSGTVNALIKLADLKQSPFWKELSTFLFWLEMLSLGGELTAAIKAGLRKSAKDLLKYEKELIERATREGVEDVDGLIDELRHFGGNTRGRSIIVTDNPAKVKAFEEGLERLENLRLTGKITEENAIDYLEEAMPYFNHKVVDGEVIQVDYRNCGNTVEVINEFLKGEKIRVAEPSALQGLEKVASKFGGGIFSKAGLPRLNSNPALVGEGERIIVYGIYNTQPIKGVKDALGGSTDGHFFYGIKRNGVLHFYDGQTGEFVKFDLTPGSDYFSFIENGQRFRDGFAYLKIKK